MNTFSDIHQDTFRSSAFKKTPSSKEQFLHKLQEQTATKNQLTILTQTQNILIRNQLFSLYKHQILKGKIKVQEFQDLSVVEITFYHKIYNSDVQQNIKLTFHSDYPSIPPKIEIHTCNLTHLHPYYVVPNFLTMNELISQKVWTSESKLAEVLAKIYQTINDFHQSQMQRLKPKPQMLQKSDNLEVLSDSLVQSGQKQDDEMMKQIKKQRRKSSNMTGCADKELTQTKNLNRHFRSKLREVLRDLVTSPEDQTEDSKFVDHIFTPNRVGFQDIRKALNNKWFNQGVRKQMNSGQFLHKILRGMMGIKSKKLMIKYYHVMVSAVEEPNCFIRWKYD